MNAVDIIKFVHAAKDSAAGPCSCCGGVSHWPDAKRTFFNPFVDDTVCVEFTVCSEACEAAFFSYPELDSYVMKVIDEAARYHDLSLKMSFAIWREEIHNDVNS